MNPRELGQAIGARLQGHRIREVSERITASKWPRPAAAAADPWCWGLSRKPGAPSCIAPVTGATGSAPVEIGIQAGNPKHFALEAYWKYSHLE